MRNQRYGALLTASHVADQVEDQTLVITGARNFLRFPATVVRFAQGLSSLPIDVDLAAIALPSEAVAEMSDVYDFSWAEDMSEFDE